MGKLKSVGRYIMEDQTLGKGNFAVVELASHVITNTKVAIKIIDRRKLKEEYMQKNLYREAKVMNQLRHPNIVRLYETLKSSSLYFLVMEYVAGGDLLSYVRNQRDGYLTESKSRVFVRQLVSALHHLHERGVVHRDLKMENIILDEQKQHVKLIDFGLSNTYHTDQLLKTHCGSPEYAAPELFVSGREYGPEVDIWSFGVIVYAMVTGKLPFTAPHTENRRQRLLQQINAGLVLIHERDMHALTEDCKDLLRRCIEPSHRRIHLLDILVHPWITIKGTETFYTFQQPPKDAQLREEVITKMASFLNVNRSTLDCKVHENRCDEVGAIYNLIMDEALRQRGLWEGDHTRRMTGSRPSTSSNRHPGTPTAGERRSQTPNDDQPVRFRTPTVVGMVRPSERLEGGASLRSADFELSIVESDRSTPERPRTAAVPPSYIYTKPMGNATTVNIILARQHYFPRPSTSPCRPRNHGQRPAIFLKPGVNDPDGYLVAPHPSSVDLPVDPNSSSGASPEEPKKQKDGADKAPTKKEASKRHPKHSNDHRRRSAPQPVSDRTRVRQDKPNQRTTQTEPVRKTNSATTKIRRADVKRTDHSPSREKPQTKLQVVDMGRYFNAKHGYQVSETPIIVQTNTPRPSGGILRKSCDQPANNLDKPNPERRTSVQLCEVHRRQVQAGDVIRSIPASEGRRHSLPTETIANNPKQSAPSPVRIRLHHRDANKSDTGQEFKRDQIYHKKSPSPVKKGNAVLNRQRHTPELSRRLSQSMSSGIASYVSSASQTPSTSHPDGSRTPGMITPRPATGHSSSRTPLRTPVASVVSSDSNLTSRSRGQQERLHKMEDVASSDDGSRAGMPPRPEWKRTKTPDRKGHSKSHLKKSRQKEALYSHRNGVRQILPDKTIRIHSAKIKKRGDRPHQGPQQGHVHHSQAASHGVRLRKEHVTSSKGEHQKMLKYAGCIQDEEKRETKEKGEDDIEPKEEVSGQFSTRGLLGVIMSGNYQSKSNPNSEKEEVGSTSSSRESPTKSGVQRKAANMIPFNFIDKRHLYNKESKPIDIQKAPTVKPKGPKAVQVFDITKSHDVTSVCLPVSSNKSHSARNHEVNWGKTYALERKVSDTLKGGPDIAKLRKTPEPVMVRDS